jgi:hypothetical protein
VITNKEILNELVALEATQVHDAFLINSLDYWPAIRIRLAFGLIKRRYQKSKRKRVDFKEELTGILKGIGSLRLKPRKSEVLFVTHDNYQISVEGRIYDRVLEGYKLDCIRTGKTYSELNLATGDITFSNAQETTRRIQGRLFLLKVYCYFLTRLKRKHTHLEDPINYINRHLSEVFPGFEVTSLEINQYLIYLELLTSYFTGLLGKLGVSTVYQATYYDSVGLAINAAANQLEVTTYCVQHGGQSRNNPAFGQWTNLPLRGYEMLPDIFLCWDEESANTIKEWAPVTEYHQTKIKGYKWPELWRDGKIKYSRMPQLRQLAAGRLNILYTMQPSIGMPPAMIDGMIKQFPEGINWWFRLHPRQLGSQLELDLQQMYHDSKNIFVSEATSEPLPALMINMDLHLTSFSSCVYEAMLFNVPTIFIDRMGQEYFNKTIQSGKAKLCLTSKVLENSIYERLHSKFTE